MSGIVILIVVLLISQPSLLPVMLMFMLVGVSGGPSLTQTPAAGLPQAAGGQGIAARARVVACARTETAPACAMLQASPAPASRP